jgi:class 3 adenylate cyclase
VTFLFTDVEGSARLWEQHPEAMRVALGAHDAILRSVIEERHGYVFSTAGDAFSAAFWTPGEAVGAAIEAQLRLAGQDWPPPIGLRVRMGINAGTAEERDGNYFGPALNRAARLMSVGWGGQVLCSQSAASLLGNGLDVEIALVDLGEHRLADLARPERVFQVTHPGLRSHLPPLHSLDPVCQGEVRHLR